jgi:hypothetical protein
MASSWSVFLLLLLLLNVVLSTAVCYTRLFSFGDSTTDTGNFISRGRFTDGRLIVDFGGIYFSFLLFLLAFRRFKSRTTSKAES